MKLVSESIEELNIILIEPNLDLIKTLTENYKRDTSEDHNLTICSFGITLENGEETLYQYSNKVGEVHGNHSLINRKSHPLKSTVKTKKIKTITFNKFCHDYNIDEIEYLFIDTEGLDYEILNSIDLDKIDIKTIVFEEWSVDDDDLNKKYRTGPTFLKTIESKFKNYIWKKEMLGGMNNYHLTKNPSIKKGLVIKNANILE